MPVLNLNSFIAQVDAFAKNEPPEEVGKLHRFIALEGLGRVVERTPVDDGEARGGWQVTQGSPAQGQAESEDKEGDATIAKGAGVIGAVKPFTITWITNNVPHIEVLEFGLFDPKDPGPSGDRRPDRFGKELVSGGFSNQAPQGMVGVTFEELRSIFP